MRILSNLFKNNAEWSRRVSEADPEFFRKLSEQQHPKHLWIGCADSRVPANQIAGLDPGEMFVHRNVANVVVHTDLNCLSVIQYAVEVLKVEHIIVCGHYGCGGVAASMEDASHGLIDNWLRHIQDVHNSHRDRIESIVGHQQRVDRLCELNVIDQVANVCRTTVLQDAWRRGQDVAVHGWIYGLDDGLLRDLQMCVTTADKLVESHKAAIEFTETGERMRPESIS